MTEELYDDWPVPISGKTPNHLTVCLIVRDEEEWLPRCLDSMKLDGVPIWDELMIVDTGSTDKTVAIARAYGAKVKTFDWISDYAAARNYCESFATGDYIYWQDADETLTAGHELILEIVRKGEEDGVRPMCVMNRDQYGEIVGGHLRQQLLRKRGIGKWVSAIHEYLEDIELCRAERGIVVDHHDRAVERTWDTPVEHYDALRGAVSEHLYPRALYYLQKEHYAHKNYAEAAALGELVCSLMHGYIEERAHAALIRGDSLRRLGDVMGAQKAYLRSLQEWDIWAEPYFALGALMGSLGKWDRALGWAYAAAAQDPDAERVFFDATIYRWKRFALLAECLAHLERHEEALTFMELAVAGNPGDEALAQECELYRERAEKKEKAWAQN